MAGPVAVDALYHGRAVYGYLLHDALEAVPRRVVPVYEGRRGGGCPLTMVSLTFRYYYRELAEDGLDLAFCISLTWTMASSPEASSAGPKRHFPKPSTFRKAPSGFVYSTVAANSAGGVLRVQQRVDVGRIHPVPLYRRSPASARRRTLSPRRGRGRSSRSRPRRACANTPVRKAAKHTASAAGAMGERGGLGRAPPRGRQAEPGEVYERQPEGNSRGSRSP